MIGQSPGIILCRHSSKRSAQNPRVQRISLKPIGRTTAKGLVASLGAGVHLAPVALAGPGMLTKIRLTMSSKRRTSEASRECGIPKLLEFMCVIIWEKRPKVKEPPNERGQVRV